MAEQADLHTRAINYCGTVTQTCKRILGDFDNKTLKMKWVGICARVRGVLTPMIWKDK
jgi:hypothetical protein